MFPSRLTMRPDRSRLCSMPAAFLAPLTLPIDTKPLAPNPVQRRPRGFTTAIPRSVTFRRPAFCTILCQGRIPRQKAPDAPKEKEPKLHPLTRAEKMRARWQDPVWRAAVLARRNSPESLRKRSEAARKKWQDPAFRSRMHKARLGRIPWNRGVAPSDVTRLRMSVARKGVKKSEETKRRMSEAKLNLPDKSWKKLISESKKGKTRHYFQMRREYRALKADLRLWSDSYRLTHGRLPKVSNYEAAVVAPMLALKVRRYITLSTNLDESEVSIGREILDFDVRVKRSNLG